MENITGNYPVMIEKAVRDGDEIWFAPQNFAAVCSMNVVTKEIRLHAFLNEGADIYHYRDYFCAAIDKSKIFFAPEFSDELVIYDRDSRNVRHVKIAGDGITGSNDKQINFHTGIVAGKTLWLLPQACKRIIAVNLKTETCKTYGDELEEIGGTDLPGNAFFGLAIRVNDSIFIPCRTSDIVAEVSLATKEIRLHKVIAAHGNGFSAAVWTGKYFYLYDDVRCSLLQWSPQEGIISEIQTPIRPSRKGERTNSCFKMMYFQQEILLFPSVSSSAFWAWNEETGQWRKIGEQQKGAGCLDTLVIGDRMWFFSLLCEEIHLWKYRENTWDTLTLSYPGDEIRLAADFGMYTKQTKPSIVYENKIDGIRLFCKMVKSR